MKIGYYLSTSKTPRNQGIYVLYAFDKDWPESTLVQRCLNGNGYFSREATPYEVEIRESHKRAVSYRYTSLAGLLEDERRSDIDEAIIAQVQAIFTPVLLRSHGVSA